MIPDGRRLAFIYKYRLVTIDRNGKARRCVSRKGEFVGAAACSPSGDTLAYVAGTTAPRYGGLPRNRRVETVSGDGQRVDVLARESADTLFEDEPVWTRGGKRILLAVETH